MTKKAVLLIALSLCCSTTFSQKLLTSWSQQNIENYTLEMYNEAQKLTPEALLKKT
ncbi:hypothetical protein ACLI09_02205 [Flavobacterium sp. RHBU_24]|uniref:hypothetical protein n=1 Tax=Flavobacterium sp. RHBU_24 TaxID=3391185 RepID=UPI00398527F0